MSFENKNSYTKILVNDDMEVANKSMDLNRCNITSDKSDGIKEKDTILNKNLENVKERKQEKCNGAMTVDYNNKENVLSGYGFSKDQSLWVKFRLPIFGEIKFNPLVSFLSLLLICTLVTWCIVEKENVPFLLWRSTLTDSFTWLYIGVFNVCIIFVVVVYCSELSNIKLGSPDDEPEYNDVSWFVMLFACGMGNGLFFYSVFEPIYHYTQSNRYSADPTLTDNQLAQTAILIPMFHFGLHGWAMFSLVGLLLSLMCYREKLPLTMKSCLYPLLGDCIFGWIGEIIDVISIMCTLFGVCTSLGIGARQVAMGLSLIDSSIDSYDIKLQVLIVWCITFVATCSTISGISAGIRRLSEVAFVMGLFIMTLVLFMDKTSYLLNLFVQSIGVYLQNLIQLGWHTDAFEQLGPSFGNIDRNRFIPPNVDTTDGPRDWMDSWTFFYWGWWISFTPFCSMFLAKISKGRTVKQFLLWSTIAPTLYSFIWPILYGGVAIRLEREAAGANLCCKDDVGWFKSPSRLSELALEKDILNDIPEERNSFNWMCNDDDCGNCALLTIASHKKENKTYQDILDEYNHLEKDFGSTTLDRKLSRLSCHTLVQMWFDVMRSVPGLGNFLAIFSLCTIVIYFVTTSDSGSLVIDSLAANGDAHSAGIQRAFWATMEGATATALLTAGGTVSLTALQTMGMLSAFPNSIVICLLCLSTWKALKVANGMENPAGPQFKIGLFEPLAALPYTRLKLKKSAFTFGLFIKTMFLAPITLSKVAASIYSETTEKPKSALPYLTIFGGLFVSSIFFFVLQILLNGSWAIGLFFYLCFCYYTARLRMMTRKKLLITGHPIEDFLCSILLYPSVTMQLEMTINLEKDETAKSKDVELNTVN